MKTVVLKYATGEPVPSGAVHLKTVVEEWTTDEGIRKRLVWHYFRVDHYEEARR